MTDPGNVENSYGGMQKGIAASVLKSIRRAVMGLEVALDIHSF